MQKGRKSEGARERGSEGAREGGREGGMDGRREEERGGEEARKKGSEVGCWDRNHQRLREPICMCALKNQACCLSRLLLEEFFVHADSLRIFVQVVSSRLFVRTFRPGVFVRTYSFRFKTLTSWSFRPRRFVSPFVQPIRPDPFVHTLSSLPLRPTPSSKALSSRPPRPG